MKKIQLIEDIYDCVLKGDATQAEAKIKKLMRSHKIYPRDRIKFSEWYLWLGEPVKAFKICGELVSGHELEVISIDELCLQIRLAYLYSRLGAKYIAIRHYENIDKVIEKKNIVLHHIYPDYDSLQAYLHLNAYQYETSIKFFHKAIEYNTPGDPNYCTNHLGLADAYSGLGEYDKAIEAANRAINKSVEGNFVELACSYEVRGEHLFYKGDYAAARKDFEQSWKYFSGKPETKDLSYLAKMSGALHLLEGNNELAKKELIHAKEILEKEQSQPISKIAVLYWLNQLKDYELTFGEKIALRAHHCFSPYSFLVGKKRNPDNPDALNKWIENKYEEGVEDCWYISRDHIKSIHYEKSIDAQNGPLLDFYSGFFRNTKGEYEFLSEIEGRCLSAIIGSGSFGIYQWALIDFIYRQEFFSPKNGQDRIKKVIKKLKDKGFATELIKGHYHYENYDIPIVLNMNLDPKGVWNYFRHHLTSNYFSRIDLESFFKISKASANRWINEWHEEGIINSTGSGKSKVYYFLGGNLIEVA